MFNEEFDLLNDSLKEARRLRRRRQKDGTMFNGKENLNNAFKELRKLGYYAKQNFQCCQTCGWAAVPEDKDKVVFYNAQGLECLMDTGECCLYWAGDIDEIATVLEKHGVLLKKPASKDEAFEITINGVKK